MNAAGEETPASGHDESGPPANPATPRWIGPGLQGIDPDLDSMGRRGRTLRVTCCVVLGSLVVVLAAAVIWYAAR